MPKRGSLASRNTERLAKLTVTQLLLVSQADLADVVHLGADWSVLVQVVLGGDAEFGGVGSRGPWQLDASFQAVAATLINAASEFAAIVAARTRESKVIHSLVYRRTWRKSSCSPKKRLKIRKRRDFLLASPRRRASISNKQRGYSHICVQNKIASGVADGEVVSGQLALLWVESQLVAGEPALVSDDGGGVDQGSGEINVDISVQADALVWVGWLEAASLASKFVDEREGGGRMVNEASVDDGDSWRHRQSGKERKIIEASSFTSSHCRRPWN